MVRPRAARVARGVVGRVVTRYEPITDRIAGRVSGISIAYPGGRGQHRLVGHRAPDIALLAEAAGPRRLYEGLRSGRFVLVTPPAAPLGAVDRWTDQIDQVTAAGPSDTAVLVRPDGYVAWATEEIDAAGLRAGLGSALVHWTSHSAGIPTR
jgi:hypothetical protein